MNKFNFLLNFRLPSIEADPNSHLDALFEAGCDDAAVGVGRPGMIGLEFVRRAHTAEEALGSAIDDVTRAIPGAYLVQVGPDLVGLSELATLFHCTRQNMQKYADGRYCASDFPEPVFQGSMSLWHLAEIARWLTRHTNLTPPPAQVIEISTAAAKVNLRIRSDSIEKLGEIA